MTAKKIISMILCLAMVISCGSLVSCGDSSKNNTSDDTGDSDEFMPSNLNVTVWGAFGTDYWEAFQRDYPTINLDHSTSSDSSLATLAAAISAGNQPDMFYTNNAAQAPLGEAVSKNLVQPLDDYFTRDPDYQLSDLPSWYSSFVTFPDSDGNDHIYGVYADVSVACLVWNKDLFEAEGLDPNTPPTTWSEMQTMSKKLTKTDASGMVTQAGFVDYKWWFQHWRLTFGTSYQDRFTGKVDINTPEMVSVLNFLMSFPASYGGADKISDTVKWENGNVAMGIADIGYGQKMGNDFEVGIAALPYDDEAQYGLTQTTIAGYAWQWYGIPTGAKNPDGGWLFCRWAVTDGTASVQERAAVDNPDTWTPVYIAHIPTKQKLFDLYLDDVRSDIKANLETREEIFNDIGIDRPVNAPINADFETVLEGRCVDIVNGDLTVTDGLSDIQSTADILYNRYLKDVA